MLHRSFNPAKCKTALKLATSRIKLMKNKKNNHLMQLKRELSQLIESGKDQTARIRVEHVIREEKTLTAYELIDIYCELIVARLPIIESQKTCPIDLKEAITSVIFAAPRCADIPELQDVRKHFTAKYGKEFINAALEMRPECGVSRMLVEKLSVNAPDGQTKLKILSAIAEEYNVEWDPKSFGEKESKPYDDLLKGPNSFDNASKKPSETPIVPDLPPTSVHSPQGREEKHDAPLNYQQNLHPSSSHNFSPSDFTGGQSTPSTVPHPPVRPSVTEFGRTEIRHSHSRDENSFSSGGQNWNMEFKDATAAAQAAAESAERASLAARAAAQLSMRQQSHKSHKSNADSPRKNYDSPSENLDKDVAYNSPQDRNRNSSMGTEKEDGYVHESPSDANEGFYTDDQSSAKRYGQPASLGSGTTASVSVDDKRQVNNSHEVDVYSRNNSFEEEALKSQSSGKDRNNLFDSSPSDDANDYSNSHSHQNYFFDDSKDPFNDGKSCTKTVKGDGIYTTEAVFDSYVSDDDIIQFDEQPQYDEPESIFYSAITKEPSNNFAVDIDKRSSWDAPLATSHVSADLFSPPFSDETLPKAPSSAHRDNMAPATFDDSSNLSSESKDEVEKSSFHGKSDAGTGSYKENDLYIDSDDFEEEHGLEGSYFTEKNDSGGIRRQNLSSSSDDRGCVEVNDNELKFSTLTGGLRNKGYKTPPYRKSPSGDSLSSKGAAESSSTSTQNEPISPTVESISLNFSVIPKTKESSNLRTQFYDLGTEDFEEELPQQNLRSNREEFVTKKNSNTNYDLGMNDFKEELPKPKIANKQERKEDYIKSKFRVPSGYFDLDDDDSKEDLPKQTVTSKVRAGSGFSQRTKANPDSENNSYSKAKRGSVPPVKPISVSEFKPNISENKPKTRPNSEKHSATRPAPEEKQKPSVMEQPSTESSFKKASHVHPKLPDYDSIAALLRQNRG